MKNLDELLEEAKWGKLTKEEVEYVVQRIKSSNPENDDDLYTLLHILGRSGSIQYRKLVESFLYYPSYPMISYIAIKTLCDYWGYTQDYLNKIKQFIRGVDWDVGRGIYLLAISIAGEFLSNHPEKELFRLLIDILVVENKEEDESIELYRDAAYEALARAVGENWNDLLKDERPNPAVIEKIYHMLQNMKDSDEHK